MNVLLINSAKVFPLELLEPYGDVRLSVISRTPYQSRYAGVDSVHAVDSLYDFIRVLAIAKAIYRDRGIDYVVSPAERSLPVAGLVRSHLALPGIPFDTAMRFSHKYVMKAALRAAGLPIADFRQVVGIDAVAGAASELGWPVIVKPVFGGGGQDTHVFRSASAYAAFLAAPEAETLRAMTVPLIVEEFLDVDDEYHCDAVVHAGRTRFVAVSRYFMPLFGRVDDFTGSVTVDETAPAHASIVELHERVIAALGLDAGVTHLEVFRIGSRFVVGEITCRPAGGGILDAIRLQYGVDLWRAFVDTSLGIEPAIAAQRSDLTVANCDLPIRPGRVLDVSTEDELRALPDVLRVTMSTRVGDVIDDHLQSSSTTGLVFLGLRRLADLDSRLAALAGAYRLTTEPV